MTLTFNLPEQLFQMNKCTKLFWNLCINIEVMAQTSSIYDHFIIWPSSVTLTFNLPEQMFQTVCLLLKESICAKLFWNPCISVQVMAQTSSVYDHFSIWVSSMTLTFNLPEQMFQTALLLLKWNNFAKLFWNLCINVEVTRRTSSIYDHFIWPSSVTLTFNLPEQMFKMALLLIKHNNCAKLFWNLCINVEVMALTNPEGCTHNTCTYAQCTYIHRTEIVTTMSHSPQAGLIKFIVISLWHPVCMFDVAKKEASIVIPACNSPGNLKLNYINIKVNDKTRNVTVCNKCPRRPLTPGGWLP